VSAIGKRFLISAHRYLGLALGALFVLWFASGIVMIYTGGMPELSDRARLAHLPPLDISRVRLTAAEAAERAGVAGPMRSVVLLSVLERPAYRFDGFTTIFADNGERLEAITPLLARTVAAKFLGRAERDVAYTATLAEPDQWTLQQANALPLYKFRAADAAATELYVSPALAEVTLATTRSSRLLAWLGAIPHWLYFAPLRRDGQSWYSLVVGAAALGCALAVLGLTLGVLQLRCVRPFGLLRASPYSGWLRWHHVLGLVCGVFALAWVWSGLLSMEPFAWTNATGLAVPDEVFAGGPLELGRFPPMRAADWQCLAGNRSIKEVELARIQHEPYYIVSLGAASRPGPGDGLNSIPYPYAPAPRAALLVATATLQIRTEPFSVDSLLDRLRSALPDAPIAEHHLLSDYDAYYYARGAQAPLPVLRVKFADPARTWLYVDPATAEPLLETHRWGRVERWLYHGLHSLDFPFWYDQRPLRDIALILLCAGGLATSGLGLFLGLRRYWPRGSRSTERYRE
jgi:hypothetical protein